MPTGREIPAAVEPVRRRTAAASPVSLDHELLDNGDARATEEHEDDRERGFLHFHALSASTTALLRDFRILCVSIVGELRMEPRRHGREIGD
jgi:hypothetical protein